MIHYPKLKRSDKPFERVKISFLKIFRKFSHLQIQKNRVFSIQVINQVVFQVVFLLVSSVKRSCPQGRGWHTSKLNLAQVANKREEGADEFLILSNFFPIAQFSTKIFSTSFSDLVFRLLRPPLNKKIFLLIMKLIVNTLMSKQVLLTHLEILNERIIFFRHIFTTQQKDNEETS